MVVAKKRAEPTMLIEVNFSGLPRPNMLSTIVSSASDIQREEVEATEYVLSLIDDQPSLYLRSDVTHRAGSLSVTLIEFGRVANDRESNRSKQHGCDSVLRA
jgi:hypothetical protein